MPLDNTIATEHLLNRIIKQEYHNPEDYNFPVKWAAPISIVSYEDDDNTIEKIHSDEMRHLINTRDRCVVGIHKSKYVEQLHEPLVNNVLDVASKSVNRVLADDENGAKAPVISPIICAELDNRLLPIKPFSTKFNRD